MSTTNLLAQVKNARRDVANMRINLRSRRGNTNTGAHYLDNALRNVNSQQRQQDRQLQNVLDTIMRGSGKNKK